MLRLDFNLVLTMINLIVLFLILRKFLFRPLMDIMEQRKAMIEEGLRNADEQKEQALALKAQYEEMLAGAKEESQKIVSQARQDAREEHSRILDGAKQEASQLLKDARETIDVEREQAFKGMQTEIAHLAVSAAAKMVEKQCGEETGQAAYEQFLKEAGE